MAPAAGPVGALGRFGIEQEPVGDPVEGGGGGQVGLLGNGQGLDNPPLCIAPCGDNALRVLFAVQLDPVRSHGIADLGQEIIIGIDRDRDGFRALGQMCQLARQSRRDMTRAGWKHDITGPARAGGAGRCYVTTCFEAAEFDVGHEPYLPVERV